MTYHLAILKKQYLDLILHGKKSIESRFTKTRRAPFGRIDPGDKIFFKVSSGPVLATANVRKVLSFDKLCPSRIAEIKQQYNSCVCAQGQFWASIQDCRFGVLIWVKDIKPIPPVSIDKKDWRAWVILTEQNNFGLLAGIIGPPFT